MFIFFYLIFFLTLSFFAFFFLLSFFFDAHKIVLDATRHLLCQASCSVLLFSKKANGYGNGMEIAKEGDGSTTAKGATKKE